MIIIMLIIHVCTFLAAGLPAAAGLAGIGGYPGLSGSPALTQVKY